jgi:hypothetical protein
MRHRVRAVPLKHCKRGQTIYKALSAVGAKPTWRGRSRPTAADGGATAACCSTPS